MKELEWMKKAMSIFKLGTLKVKLNKLRTKRRWGVEDRNPMRIGPN